jgi:hypothetical protein
MMVSVLICRCDVSCCATEVHFAKVALCCPLRYAPAPTCQYQEFVGWLVGQLVVPFVVLDSARTPGFHRKECEIRGWWEPGVFDTWGTVTKRLSTLINVTPGNTGLKMTKA